ncbi:MAG: hypothetical protein HC888_13070, partial [Candidatus Competibacteraceae bacterium]|nr:hypothetical protein [Candidatus Competibacteraceae bacterium]
MDSAARISIRTKLGMVIIPLLVCSFAISGYISVVSSRRSISELSQRFMEYRGEQIQNYAADQWRNFQSSGFSEEPIYVEIIRKSIRTYAEGMIRKEGESIFALDAAGTLVFSTPPASVSVEDMPAHKVLPMSLAGELLESAPHGIHLSASRWICRSSTGRCSSWKTSDPYQASRLMTYRQLFAFGFSLLFIIIGLSV